MNKRCIITTLALLLTLAIQAQQTATYSELHAKVQHMKEKYTGSTNNSDEAIVMVLHKLCTDYQGHLTLQQFRQLHADLSAMQSQGTAPQQQLIGEAIQALRQRSDTLDIEQRILSYYARVPQEQIYLHTDRPYYAPGDTVWLRAHLVDAVTHTPISRSRYVYTELHDEQADTLVERFIMKCDTDGVFASAIILPRRLAGGTYLLAAYTQWMRNFPTEHFAYKALTVVGDEPEPRSQRARASKPTSQSLDSYELRSSSAPSLTLAQRKGQLLIQFNGDSTAPLSCAVYGSGNLIVTDYTQGKVLRIDSQTLRPGTLSIAMVNRETGDIVAESQTTVEAPQPQVTISGEARQQREPIDLTVDLRDADGTPLYGSFSLSVADADVVHPDTLQPDIRQMLQQPADYPLADMLRAAYPRTSYGFQTSQTITGRIKGTLFSRLKNPHLWVVNNRTGHREEFELGDSSRFTLTVDNPEGTVFTLESTRRTGSTSMVELQVDPLTFPALTPPTFPSLTQEQVPIAFKAQAERQQTFNRDSYIELPEVVKLGVRKKPTPTNFMNKEAPRGIPADDPRIDRAATVSQLLIPLGMRVEYVSASQRRINTMDRAGLLVYVDNFVEDDHDYVLDLIPTDIKSIEYFTPNNAVNSLFAARPMSFTGKVPGVLFIFLKDGSEIVRSRSKYRLSMATIRQPGYRYPVEFYSPQYTTKDDTPSIRSDQRTTLYWTPKLTTDADGTATVRFYASDVSRRYLVTLEGVSDNGVIIHHQQVIE